MDRDILHVDANNFYASCELLSRPDLKNKPVAICPNSGDRHSIILAKNEIAKKYNIQTGEPKFLALKKCKDLIVIEPNYDKYVEYSQKLFDIYCRYTDRVESFGIDECWLDVTESKKLFGSPYEIAKSISETVKKELNLTVSIGVSFTKYFAKIGSDYKKPDAITIINKDNFKNIVWPISVSSFLMVGSKTNEILQQYGIKTIKDLAESDYNFLSRLIGNVKAKSLINQSNGISEEEVAFYYDDSLPQSISHNTTVSRDLVNFDEIKSVLYSLSEMVYFRMKKIDVIAGGITIIFKDNNFKTVTRQYTTNEQITSSRDIFNYAIKLFDKHYLTKKDRKPLRLIGVGVFNLVRKSDVGIQMSINDINKKIFPDLEKSLDEIRNKYGFNSIKPAITIEHKDLCEDLVPKNFYAFKDNKKIDDN